VLALDTALEVNRHLNREVEQLTSQMESLRQEKEAALRRAKEVSQKLSEARRQGGDDTGIRPPRAPPSHGAAEDDSNEDTEQETEQEADDVTGSGSLSQAFDQKEWEELRQRGVASGWLVDPTMVELGPEAGRGTFGVTYHATWHGGHVALKSVRVEARDEIMSFLREVDVMSSIRHPFVLPFIGAVLDPPHRCWVLTEWMPGGTLKSWLHGDRDAGVPPRRAPLSARLRKSLEVARGMQALQESEPQVMHRDLKPTNVLLDASGAARVADMGLSRRFTVETATVLTGETGTYLYMAPEVMQHNVYDAKADVFSWAVMTAELITQQVPYQEFYMTPLQVAMAVCNSDLRPSLPNSLHPGVRKLLEAAWSSDPVKRPFFREAVRKMTKFVEHVELDEKERQQQPAANPVGGLLRGFAGLVNRPQSAA